MQKFLGVHKTPLNQGDKRGRSEEVTVGCSLKMWSWPSKKGSPARGGPDWNGDQTEGGERPWRCVLRNSAGAGVHLSFAGNDLAAAQSSLERQVHDFGGTIAGVDAFLGEVVLVKIELLPGSERGEKRGRERVLRALPFTSQALTSLKVLRLAEGTMVDCTLISGLMHASLREADLGGQKLTTAQLVALFGAEHKGDEKGGWQGGARLPELRTLRLSRNSLDSVPADVLSQMPGLTALDLSDNALAEAPPALFEKCPALVSLNLERNGRNGKLAVRGLDLRSCRLQTLLLGLNTLDYVPNLTPVSSLSDLSLFSLRIHAPAPRRDPRCHFEALQVHAEILRPKSVSGGAALNLFPTTKEVCVELKAALAPLLRSSGGWHPLFAALIARMATEPLLRKLIVHGLSSAGANPGSSPNSVVQHVLGMLAGPEHIALEACVAVCTLVENHVDELLELQVVPVFCVRRRAGTQ